MEKRLNPDKKLQAYIIGLALGDGNLSNPNGRATRLRITCDKKYPKLHKHIINSISTLLPDNKTGTVNRKGCLDVYCYSNKWESLLGWYAFSGSKYRQKVSIPKWVLKNKTYTKECLRGLIQTDGSVYKDRGYLMVNITSIIPALVADINKAIISIGYKPNIQVSKRLGRPKHTIRISKNTQKFIDDIVVWKS